MKYLFYNFSASFSILMRNYKIIVEIPKGSVTIYFNSWYCIYHRIVFQLKEQGIPRYMINKLRHYQPEEWFLLEQPTGITYQIVYSKKTESGIIQQIELILNDVIF